jgi:tRNA A-37 threonylcarbamoyl transferase component Bud32
LQLAEGNAGRDVLFAKLYTHHHVRSDRSYKLGRLLLYGALEDEAPFASVRQLVLYEDHMTRVMRDAGLPVPAPLGIIEITPAREYAIAFEYLADGDELDAAEVDEQLIDQGLELVQNLWGAGIAHRDIKPGNLMVVDGDLRLIDTAFAQVRPSPWRQAVDLGAMMLVLALGSDADTVYGRASERFSQDELGEAFAATRGFVIPAQLREHLEADGRELLDRFRELAPAHAPIRVHRWGRRRIAAAVGVVLAAALFGALTWVSFTTAGML